MTLQCIDTWRPGVSRDSVVSYRCKIFDPGFQAGKVSLLGAGRGLRLIVGTSINVSDGPQA